jgi:hypothetical protein
MQSGQILILPVQLSFRPLELINLSLKGGGALLELLISRFFGF